MKFVTVSGLTIQFERYDSDSGSDIDEAERVIQEINQILSAAMNHNGARISGIITPSRVKTEEA